MYGRVTAHAHVGIYSNVKVRVPAEYGAATKLSELNVSLKLR